jgi:TPP-dependent pyruvate/acetoin dehydrogenase alpha subunit
MAVERDKCVAERARLTLGESKLNKIYRRMVPIRRFDDKIAGMYSRGRITGFCCLYAGEEGVAAGPKYAAAGLRG